MINPKKQNPKNKAKTCTINKKKTIKLKNNKVFTEAFDNNEF